jgi:hypothetical protein
VVGSILAHLGTQSLHDNHRSSRSNTGCFRYGHRQVIVAENISNVDYQLVKLAVGAIGSTEAIPGGSEFGLVVAVSCMPSVSGIAQVSVLSR